MGLKITGTDIINTTTTSNIQFKDHTGSTKLKLSRTGSFMDPNDVMFIDPVTRALTNVTNTNWDAAFGWGNHASAGYQAASTAITTSNIGSQSVSVATSATQVVTLQDDAPAGVNGKLWWETDTGKLKVYYGATSAWIDALPMPDVTLFYTKAGGAITGDVSIQQSLTVTGNILTSGTVTATGGNSTNWNTAFGWGNHGAQGYATQSYVNTAVSNLVDAAPGTLDTLNELAAALGDDPNFATTIATSIGTKQAQLNGTGFVKVSGTTVSYDNSTYLTSITSANVTTALGYTPYNSTNPNGYITGISFANVSAKPTTISGYGITDAITTGNIGSQSVTGASYVSSNLWSSSTANEAVRVFAPAGASASWDGGITGAFRIKLPQRANNTMWTMKVRIYNYASNQVSEYTLGNYSYDQGGYNASAQFTGSANTTARPVRFGNQDGVDCVWIGELTDSWSYPVISVIDFTGGFRGGNAANWEGSWNITYVTEFGTVALNISPNTRLATVNTDAVNVGGNAVIHAGNIGSQSVATAGALTSMNISQFTNNSGYLTALPSHNHDDRYFTETESDARFQPLENQRLRTTDAVRFSNTYTTAWFRNDNSNTGLYNEATTMHLSSNENGFWDVSSTNTESSIRFYTGGHKSALRGYVYSNSSSQIGFLTSDGNWGLRVDSSKNVKVYGVSLTIGNTTSSDIYMVDTDEGNRRIHCNSGRVGFLSTANGWGSYSTSDGSWRSDQAMYSPIFYDIDDVNYYVDPASISNIWKLHANGKYHYFGSSSNWDNGSLNGQNDTITNVHFQGHQDFWIGAGNTKWYTSVASGHHDLLINTMQSGGSNTRGITFTATLSGASAYRLGRWFAHSNQAGSYLQVDGNIKIGATSDSYITPTAKLYVAGNTAGADVFAVDGINGRLFTVSDDLSDSLFSVNTIAGLPVIEAFADNTVVIGKYGLSTTFSNDGSITTPGGLTTGGTITTPSHGNSSQWNTAYGWGNHASAGYQAAATAITTSNIGSQSVSYATSAGSAPNAGNLNTSYGVTAGAGNGLKFWNGEDTYKIHMGNSAEYHYGPVTDYSIKTNIDSVGATRGFTWGQNGVTPIAALNVGNGNMQIAGTFTAIGTITGSNLSGTNTGDQTNISGNAATAGGLAVHGGTNNEANKIVRTDANGYINAGWINSISGNMGFANRIARITCSDDQYMRFQTLEEFKISLGLSGKNNYSRRIDYTSDADYHVGSFGHGGAEVGNIDRIFHYGSGFFDVWSGNGTYAPGTSHLHGFNALHYTTGYGGNAYGWQMASQYDQPGLIYARWCSGGTFSAWQTIITSTNIGSQSVSYATSAGTVANGVYTNATNTIINGDSPGLILYGASSYNADAALHLGGWSTDTTYARIRTSNGNLHIDTRGGAGNAYQMYFNHYSSGDMYFGNGGGTVYVYGGRLKHSNGTSYVYESGTWGISITGNAATATNVAWTGVTGRPTALSQFSNDLGNYGGWLTTSGKAADSELLDGINSSSFVRNDTTGQYLRAYYQYGSYLTTESPIDLRNQMGGSGMRVDFMNSGGGGSWNHVITFSGYDAYNMYQLGGYYDGGSVTNLYVRSEANHGTTSWTAWRRLLNEVADPYAVNMNQYVRTSDTVSFANFSGSSSGTNTGDQTNISGNAATATSATQVVTIQDDAPGGAAGKLWWESDTGKLKVYYNSAWVDATPVPDTSLFYAKAGGAITGDVTIQQTLTVVGNTLIQGTLTETSDISLKENILPLENSLAKVMKLNGVSFNKKATPTVKEIGFIAQEVEAVIPDLVTETNEGIKTVSYSRVAAVLVETIKEQQAQIDALTDMVNLLTKKLNDL
jgi:hypothetical protein